MPWCPSTGMRTARQYLVLTVMFLAVPLAALTLVPTVPSGYRAFSDQNDPTNPLLYVVLVLVTTAVLLVLIKRSRLGLLKAVIFGAMGLGLFSVVSLFLMLASTEELVSMVLGAIISGSLLYLLVKYPRWYVVNGAGLVIGVGAALILGLSLGILPSLILLTALAVYDALSVYVTKHMLTLAEGVSDLGLPIVLVVPGNKGAERKKLDLKDRSKDQDREVMLMGLGDTIIPSVLVISAAANLPALSSTGWPQPAMLVAVMTLLAILIGFLSLMFLIAKGRPQAGLPFLNGSAIIGFAMSYFLVYQDLGFGFG
ncbi:MAG: presenilin family intramembrane aspartyl protease [Methanomassiliicoccales archaeon]|nr:presenilin family intramembrane aspartyl protease [Methanomassiliicoccales archaeon]